MPSNKSPEEWEASDHIDTLKTQIQERPNKDDHAHHSYLRATIWMIRHMELAEKRNGNGSDDETLPGNVSMRAGKWRVSGPAGALVCIGCFLLLSYIALAITGLIPWVKIAVK